LASSTSTSRSRWRRWCCSAHWRAMAAPSMFPSTGMDWCSRPRWRRSRPERPRTRKARLCGLFSGRPSAGAVGDATLGEVVGGQLDLDLVTGEDADVVLAHLARDVRGDDVTIFQPNTEGGVGEGVNDLTFHFN